MFIQVAAAVVLLLQAPATKPAPPKVVAATKPAKPAATDVAVTLTYKGKGTVDAQHQLIAWLFTDTNITPDSRPVATESTAKNGDTITFKNAPSGPLYLFVVYDEKGGYDGRSGPPPAGVPKALYAKTAKGAPTPVKPGEAVRVTFTDAERWK